MELYSDCVQKSTYRSSPNLCARRVINRNSEICCADLGMLCT